MSATPTITMHSVTSSQIAAIGHSPELSLLAIQFPPKKSTGISDTYQYQGVDAAMFAEFLAAESQGSFFIQRIKKFPEQFPFAKLGAPAAVGSALIGEHPAIGNAQVAHDHAVALAINAECYAEPLPGGQRYSRTTFKDTGYPILLNADGSRSTFCDLDDGAEGKA